MGRKRIKCLIRSKGNQDIPDVPPSDSDSSDDVGDDPISKLLDLVLQDELPLLHSSELELVAIATYAKQLDLLVEAAMLDLQKS
jgi:hypothetical protein